MNNKAIRNTGVICILGALGSFALPSSADIQLTSNGFIVSNSSGTFSNVRVSGPNGFEFDNRGGAGAADSGGGVSSLPDGSYTYEVDDYQEIGERTVTDDFNGRGTLVQKIVVGESTSGHFRVVDGQVIQADGITEE